MVPMLFAALALYVLFGLVWGVTGPGYPGAGNVFIPQATSDIVDGFSRNVKSFRLPRYVQYVQAPKTEGKYLRLTAKQGARVVNRQDFIWPDGSPRPTGEKNAEAFTWVPFTCERYDYPFGFGDLTVQQAAWDIKAQHAAIVAQQCMTDRTIAFMTLATTTGNWPASNTDTATNMGGGKFDVGTSTTPYLKKGLTAAAIVVNQQTLGVVQPDQLQIVINPNTAKLWAASQELHDYIRNSDAAKQEILQGNMQANRYGLPSTVYGYPIIVEDCVKDPYRKDDAAETLSYAFPDDYALMVSRVGGMEGVYGMPTFSTLTMMWYQDEMTVEAFDDRKNRRIEGHVVSNYVELLTSPRSGFLFSDITT